MMFLSVLKLNPKIEFTNKLGDENVAITYFLRRESELTRCDYNNSTHIDLAWLVASAKADQRLYSPESKYNSNSGREMTLTPRT